MKPNPVALAGAIIFLVLLALWNCSQQGIYRLHLILPDEEAQAITHQITVWVLDTDNDLCDDWMVGTLDPESQSVLSKQIFVLPINQEGKLHLHPAGLATFMAEAETSSGGKILRACIQEQVQTGTSMEVTLKLEWVCRPEPENCSNGHDDDCDGAIDLADSDCQPQNEEPSMTEEDGGIGERESPDGADLDEADAQEEDNSILLRYRSIGTNSGVLYSQGTASIDAGSNRVVFGGDASLPAEDALGAIGAGDRITLDESGGSPFTAYILSRESAASVIIQETAPVSKTNVSYQIRRAYNSIMGWVGGIPQDLVTRKAREIGIAYKDGPLEGDVTLAAFVTDADHYLMLTVAEGQRHQGKAGTGVLIDGVNDTEPGIRIYTDYTRVEWFEMTRFRGKDAVVSVRVAGASHVVLEHLLIYDFADPNYSISGIWCYDPSDFSVRNSIIYDGDRAAVRIDSDCAGVIENCTLYQSEYGVDENGGTATTRNVISMGNSVDDFRISNGTQSHSLSSDATAVGVGSLANKSIDNQFVSTTDGAVDLHLKSSSEAIGQGENLFEYFQTDIDGAIRPSSGNWDIGADEF